MEKRAFIHVDDVKPDLVPLEKGWKQMDIRWLVSGENTAAENVTWFRAIFPPGAEHRKHKHLQAEEVFYIIRGRGASGLDDQEVEMGAGTAGYVPRGAVHWFRNLSQSEPVEVVGVYVGSGVTSLDKSEYVFVGELTDADRQVKSRY